MNNNILYFGVGCFHFGFFPEEEGEKTGKDYLAELRWALEGIPNIEEIELNPFGDFEDRKLPADFHGSDFCETFEGFPNQPGMLMLSFEIRITERIQKDLVESQDFPTASPLPAEKFRVWIRYGFNAPVSFVEVVDPTESCEGSDAIWMVREFLRKEFECRRPKSIRFETMPPTPFHVDFSLQEEEKKEPESTESQEDIFQCQHLSLRGYDEMNFHWKTGAFKDTAEAFETLMYLISQQLQFFYHMQHIDLHRNQAWESIATMLQELVRDHKQEKFRSFWFNTFRSGPRIHQAMISLAEFRSTDIEVMHSILTSLKYLQNDPGEPAIQAILESEFEDVSALPTEEAEKILTLLETRRSKRINIVVTVLAAILGGAIGALITIGST